MQAWRSAGQLPFPEFDQSLREDQEDILDYPTEGSPGYEQHAELSPAPPASQPAPGTEPERTHRRLRFRQHREGGDS